MFLFAFKRIVHPWFYDFDALLGEGNAGIELKSDEENEGVEVHPYHHDDNGTDGAVELIVGVEIVDIIDKAREGQDS